MNDASSLAHQRAGGETPETGWPAGNTLRRREGPRDPSARLPATSVPAAPGSPSATDHRRRLRAHDVGAAGPGGPAVGWSPARPVVAGDAAAGRAARGRGSPCAPATCRASAAAVSPGECSTSPGWPLGCRRPGSRCRRAIANSFGCQGALPRPRRVPGAPGTGHGRAGSRAAPPGLALAAGQPACASEGTPRPLLLNYGRPYCDGC
jgi:hypothetical protein